MQNNDITEQLNKGFVQQKLRLQQMLTLLADELEAVKQRDGDRLVEIAQQKELQLEAIKNADAKFNNDNTQDIINSSEPLLSLRAEIKQLLEECQQQNEVIYLTATQNQIAVQQVKNLLLGGSKNMTYNEYGQKHSASSLGSGIKA